MASRPPTDGHDPALSLTMAVIGSSPTPLLLLDGELRVAGASQSFCEAFRIDPTTAVGKTLLELGAGEWDLPQLRTFLNAIAGGKPQATALEAELAWPGVEPRCLCIHARLLVYEDLSQPRLLVAIADVTDARASERAKDEVVERLSVLLHEVRHRVANSLQIVSAVLLQNAGRTKSAETRSTLTAAHNRVMSVAALERQLSTSGDGDQSVNLQTYFRSLCDNMATALIGEGQKVSLVVTAQGLAPSRVSVSLGLIVTELVTNALKYAFPNERAGQIEIAYEAQGLNWSLIVKDDGVGMPANAASIGTGLGTSIINALARQLKATIKSWQLCPAQLFRSNINRLRWKKPILSLIGARKP